jgi:hypothetical protein
MSETNSISPHWQSARSALLAEIPGWFDSQETEPLTLSLPDEDWLLEITPDGRLICVAGYDLDDMKSMLSDGTAEDLGSDELAKQVKFFLQQTTEKYRRRLVAEGFTERIEMTDDFVAANFEQAIDLSALPEVRHKIHTCQSWFRP